MSKPILAFALIVLLDGDIYEKPSNYYLQLQECRYFAKELSRNKKYYQPIKAYCKPMMVDPKEKTVIGHIINEPVEKPEEKEEEEE